MFNVCIAMDVDIQVVEKSATVLIGRLEEQQRFQKKNLF